jgi:hypothetical protein
MKIEKPGVGRPLLGSAKKYLFEKVSYNFFKVYCKSIPRLVW